MAAFDRPPYFRSQFVRHVLFTVRASTYYYCSRCHDGRWNGAWSHCNPAFPTVLGPQSRDNKGNIWRPSQLFRSLWEDRNVLLKEIYMAMQCFLLPISFLFTASLKTDLPISVSWYHYHLRCISAPEEAWQLLFFWNNIKMLIFIFFMQSLMASQGLKTLVMVALQIFCHTWG